MLPLAPPEFKRKVIFAVASISAQDALSEFANYLVKVWTAGENKNLWTVLNYCTVTSVSLVQNQNVCIASHAETNLLHPFYDSHSYIHPNSI